MSMPSISDINPNININRDDAVNVIIASIAMEELALAHILNAEGEKLQYVLGTLEGRPPGDVTICDIMAVTNSVHKTLRDVTKAEMLLQLKLEDAIELAGNTEECQLTIRGQKIWRDGNNVAGTRPPTVEISLLRDGEVFRTATVDSAGDGTYTFACLPAWRDSANRYTYQVDEPLVPPGYRNDINGYTVTNTVLPGSITIEGSKVWVDDDNVRQVRPPEITAILLQNGVRFRTASVTSPPDAEDTVTFRFTGVPQFDDTGVPYVYTLDEEAVEGYGKVVSGVTITNTFEQIFTTVEGSKTWEDNDNENDTRPQDITVILLQNNSRYRTAVIPILPETENPVAFRFTDVPRFDDAGAPFVYTVDEEDVALYTKTINGFAITNTLIP